MDTCFPNPAAFGNGLLRKAFAVGESKTNTRNVHRTHYQQLAAICLASGCSECNAAFEAKIFRCTAIVGVRANDAFTGWRGRQQERKATFCRTDCLSLLLQICTL